MKLCVLGSALSNHVVQRANAFRELGHDVVLISPSEGAVALPSGSSLPIIDCRSGTQGKIGYLFRVLKTVWSARADVFHAHYAADLTTWAAWLLRKRPLVITIMGGDVLFGEQGNLGSIGRWLTRRSVRAADLITVKSKHLGDVIADWGVPRSKIEDVIWGVDANAFDVAPETAARRRASWGVSESARVIFSPRMLRPLYNQLLMIEAFARVHSETPETRMVISTFNQDDSYRMRVADRAVELDIAEQITFVSPVDAEDMAASYAAADIVLSLPPSDGTPQSVLEAMATGTPVISADIAHLRDLFRHRETTWVTALEPQAVADGIRALLGNRDVCEKIIAGARSLVRERADFPREVRRVEARLLELASAGVS